MFGTVLFLALSTTNYVYELAIAGYRFADKNTNGTISLTTPR